MHLSHLQKVTMINDSNYSRAFDICKCYSSILYNNNMNIPIYNIFCDLQDYDGRKIICGEYFIDNVIIEKYKE